MIDKPLLLVFATKVIERGTELRYDYGGVIYHGERLAHHFLPLLM